jgi:hypothetical protein
MGASWAFGRADASVLEALKIFPSFGEIHIMNLV